MKWKGVWDKTLASARNVDMTTFLGLLFCLEWEKYQKKYQRITTSISCTKMNNFYLMTIRDY